MEQNNGTLLKVTTTIPATSPFSLGKAFSLFPICWLRLVKSAQYLQKLEIVGTPTLTTKLVWSVMFGVGFYAAYLAADHMKVYSKHKDSKRVQWNNVGVLNISCCQNCVVFLLVGLVFLPRAYIDRILEKRDWTVWRLTDRRRKLWYMMKRGWGSCIPNTNIMNLSWHDRPNFYM